MDEKSNYQKMLDGDVYNGVDPSLLELQRLAQRRMVSLDQVSTEDIESRMEALKGILGSMDGPSIIVPPFSIEFGLHIHLGKWVFINKGATFLDSNLITIGDNSLIGPNVQFLTVSHPIKPEERLIPLKSGGFLPFEGRCIASPITLGKECWIGAGAILMPGITIGAGTVVGAGSVVTKSLPERVVAFGNPARVIRSVDIDS